MNEHSYTRSIVRLLRQNMHCWKINDNYAGGVVDLFIEGSKCDAWIEIKYVNPFPKRSSTLIDLTNTKYLSKLQQQWLSRRYKTRGDCYVLVGSEHGGHVFCDEQWLTPFPAQFLAENSLNSREIASFFQKKVGQAVA